MFTSEKILPYVYICVNKNNNEFYIGYRSGNKLPSHEDLPKYKTSSKLVKPIFDEFNWYIIAEFFDGNDAFIFEQDLIKENIHNPLNLNRNIGGQCYWGGKHHSLETKQKMSIIAKTRSPEYNEKISESLKGRTFSEEHKKNLSESKKGKLHTPDTKEKMSNTRDGMYIGEKNNFYGKTHTDEAKLKISEAGKGRIVSDEHKLKLSLINSKPKLKNCVCYHCGKIGDAANITRWHNDNCKHKIILSS